MNLHEQLGALEMGVDQLIQAVVAPQAENIPETPAVAATATQEAPLANHVASGSKAEDVAPEAAAVAVEAAESAPTSGEARAAQLQPTLEINRPAQNEITMTIGGQTVALRAEQIGQLIEELSNARASMTPEPPPGIPPGWRFVSTKNPVMAVQKQSNGDRLLVMRHTGHGWVPFTFSPDMVIQMYMMLTKG
ncbi:hypothetical protein B0G76_3567 [Paraburkholderia sp. BL23I1N1]|uniref:hypothetical protein n=1 Tax=Paraburkholderia sp. BL23I1N1 TaxID=1938802 RepID=UPI000E735E3B|nr:hypothetical protein [Paraburkholderia sp. BL23I1N1]RKE37319.1 hypothetical protein B0G76_3567 [Paraburkholderia sp. BL23I1N1]